MLVGGKHHLYQIYRKNHISMYFLRNIIFHFSSRKDITFLRKRNAIFPDDTRKIPVFQCYFLERICFQNIWRKYHISIIYLFFEEHHLSFFVKRIRSYFREKEISSFLMTQEMYRSTIFLDWKKLKIWIASNVGFFINL